jgi:hypothetical protein
VTKYLRKQLKRKSDLFWLTASDVSVHCGGKGRAEQRSSHQGSQEAEEGTMPELKTLLFSPLFY